MASTSPPGPPFTDPDAFSATPSRTLIRLSVPVLFSLVAEPVTGLVDTAFVAQLGSEALAGLGVGTIALSSVLWVFNFLGIGTQTEVARALGGSEPGRAAGLTSLSIRLGVLIGLGMAIVGAGSTSAIAAAMGASGMTADAAETYMHIRWLGVPAVLAMLGAFGALRGVQDMRTPLWIALGINGLNVVLDAVLIFGLGPLPALGITGAAVASTGSQWVGAVATLVIVRRRFGTSGSVESGDIRRLLAIGFDLFVRTGMLTVFLVLATRAATRLGSEAGAAHQAIRQVWIFTAMFLDAWAVSAQSLVGFYTGASRIGVARRVAAYASVWSLGTGMGLAAVLWTSTSFVSDLLVPVEAAPQFAIAWWLALVSLPIGALTFATDGIHWGTGDFAYLRNATTGATVASSVLLIMLERAESLSLEWIWALTLLWVTIRALAGIVRIWPGVGSAPLTSPGHDRSHAISA